MVPTPKNDKYSCLSVLFQTALPAADENMSFGNDAEFSWALEYLNKYRLRNHKRRIYKGHSCE